MYTELVSSLVLKSSATPVALATTGVKETYAAFVGMKLRALMFNITTAPAVACAVQVKLRTAVGVTLGEVVLAVVNIPVTAVAGKVFYKEIESVTVLPGQELAFEVLTADDDCEGIFGADAFHVADSRKNDASAVAST